VRRVQAAMGRLPAALLGQNPCNHCFEWVNSTSGVAAKAAAAVHLGKIGWEASCSRVSLSNTMVAGGHPYCNPFQDSMLSLA
jgi:hypothetical protein